MTALCRESVVSVRHNRCPCTSLKQTSRLPVLSRQGVSPESRDEESVAKFVPFPVLRCSVPRRRWFAVQLKPNIFISYRREDAGGYAGRLEEGLERTFGPESVFRDVSDLQPGQSYPAVLERRIRSSVAVLVLIGPRWLDARRDGVRRLGQPDDLVSREISVALAGGKPVIPVLVAGAAMPDETVLPAALKPLAGLHAITLEDEGWSDGLGRLAGVLAPLLAARPSRLRRWSVRLAAASLACLVAGLGAWWLMPSTEPRLAGTWQARVTYDWGDSYAERFEFERVGGRWEGMASYLGTPRVMESLRIDGREIHFETVSEVVAGEETRMLRHRYDGELAGNLIRFRLVSSGGFSTYRPISFEAGRAAGAGP